MFKPLVGNITNRRVLSCTTSADSDNIAVIRSYAPSASSHTRWKCQFVLSGAGYTVLARVRPSCDLLVNKQILAICVTPGAKCWNYVDKSSNLCTCIA